MRPIFTIVLLGAIALVCAGAASAPSIVTPQEITWGAGPASLPSGAQAVALYGDPSKDGLFALRLKLPKGYRIPPHMHPKPEVVTVISGAFHFGMGETADDSKAKTLPAGSFFSVEPGMAHFAFVAEETVVQINSTGPWGITYINPKDDPRQSTQ